MSYFFPYDPDSLSAADVMRAKDFDAMRDRAEKAEAELAILRHQYESIKTLLRAAWDLGYYCGHTSPNEKREVDIKDILDNA